MSDEHIELTDDRSNVDLGSDSEIVKSSCESGRCEEKQNKPKRKNTKRKNIDNESSGERDIPIQRQRAGGSTVQQARKQRKRKQDIADKLGLVTDGFSDAKPERRPRKPRLVCKERKLKKDKTFPEEEEDNVEEIEEEDGSDEEERDLEFENYVESLLPFLMPRQLPPQDTVLNKIVSAFAGYPVCTHVSEINPNKSKLIIEIDI